MLHQIKGCLLTYIRNLKLVLVTSTNQSINNLWKELYLGIRDANNVIANVPEINMNEELKNRIIGEAKFLRALNYFNLVRCFGEVPLRTEPVQAGDDQGLPVSSIVKIYDLIIDDLNFASIYCWGRNEASGNYVNNLGRATNTLLMLSSKGLYKNSICQTKCD